MTQCEWPDSEYENEDDFECGDADGNNRPEATHKLGFMQSDGGYPGGTEETWWEEHNVCQRHAEWLKTKVADNVAIEPLSGAPQ